MKDLREILKNCPSGMELDCTLCENVFFDKVIEDAIYPIILYHENNGCRNSLCLTEDGKFNFRPGYKCVIFPKGKTTWEGFQRPFKNGDVLYVDCTDKYDDKQYDYIFIFDKIYNGQVYSYCHYYIPNDEFQITDSVPLCLTDDKYPIRFATEEEKEKLFNAIENNGYKWNENTKSLEKINKPNFKNGDVLESGIGNLVLFSHTKNSFGKDIVYFHCILTPLGKLEIGENCGVGGTENCTLASDKQKERLFKALNEAGYNWDAETKTLIHNNEDYFKITLKLFKQLPSQQIEGVKTEDIPNKIAELLSKALKKKIEVKGDGIKADINIKIENI